MTEEIVTLSAMGYLQADHQRLDVLMGQCLDMIAAGNIAAAAETFGGFRHGLLRHINIEESLLFPAFESAAGLGSHQGPTAQMRHEHQEITRLLVLMQDTFAARRFDEGMFGRLRSQLDNLLRQHNVREERVVYPMTDSLLPADRLEQLVRQMRSF